MIKTIKGAILLVAMLLMAWLLPWFYTFLTASPSWSPFTLYSCVVHSFASVGYDEEGNFEGRDRLGNTYTENQFDSILPMFYYRQLASRGAFPTRIEGEPITVQEAERSGFIFRNSPSDINRPGTGLYQLLESVPARVDFEAPTDVFRITDTGIEFVDMESNTVNRAKSEAFTRRMLDRGFRFPARVVAGNASTRKSYDNGYFLVDADGALFHMKQMLGRPFVRRTEIPASLGIRHFFVTEFPDQRLFGFLTDRQNRLYALEAEDYSLHEIPVGEFDPTQDGIMIIGDKFYWTVTVQNAESERLVAVNARDYSKADEYRPDTTIEAWERRAEYLFPFTLSFTSPLDGFVKPRLAGFSWQALGLGALLALAYALLHRRTIRCRIPALCGILLFGLFLFIPLVAMEKR
ncbi:MAG TPA: DUF4857 domain-containing protein [Candidatus Alistipes avicola]|uniref:DUF4857 domain-containing protein n=2 Tax=Alistipes TaxID=239759 RepID=A0A9D2IBP6_9BACT|nr:DUF4857 domain-containing protein [Candidatus Alistipes avicola]